VIKKGEIKLDDRQRLDRVLSDEISVN